jgi:hypothetical protein
LEDHAALRDEILHTMTRDAIRAEAKALGSACFRCKTKVQYASNLATFRLQVCEGRVGEWVAQ